MTSSGSGASTTAGDSGVASTAETGGTGSTGSGTITGGMGEGKSTASGGGGGSANIVASDALAEGGVAGFAVFTSRGGGSDGAAFTGSGALPAGLRPFTATGVSANEAFDGTLILRCRARRSTNCRATTSSMVLDALLTSMPWSRLRSAITSWLEVLSSSATL
jgi:hypothetical protein